MPIRTPGTSSYKKTVASPSAILSFLLYQRMQAGAAFRFELGFYGFGVLFLLMLLR